MRLSDQIARAAAGKGPVIISGEQERMRRDTARMIHTVSRRDGDYDEVNLPALPAVLRNRELFGNRSVLSHVDANGNLRLFSPGRCFRSAGGTLCVIEPNLLDARDQEHLIEFSDTGWVELLNYRGPGLRRHVKDVQFVALLQAIESPGCRLLIDHLLGRPDTIHIELPLLHEWDVEMTAIARSYT